MKASTYLTLFGSVALVPEQAHLQCPSSSLKGNKNKNKNYYNRNMIEMVTTNSKKNHSYSILLRMAQTGQLKGRVGEEQLIELLEQVHK